LHSTTIPPSLFPLPLLPPIRRHHPSNIRLYLNQQLVQRFLPRRSLFRATIECLDAALSHAVEGSAKLGALVGRVFGGDAPDDAGWGAGGVENPGLALGWVRT
jgi:hypothetical protein